jgi:hypothetical protein
VRIVKLTLPFEIALIQPGASPSLGLFAGGFGYG